VTISRLELMPGLILRGEAGRVHWCHSERVALIYLHSSDKRQRALADAVGKAARTELARSKKAKKPGRSGTRVARRQGDTSVSEHR
jgi:hypothetical protein